MEKVPLKIIVKESYVILCVMSIPLVVLLVCLYEDFKEIFNVGVKLCKSSEWKQG